MNKDQREVQRKLRILQHAEEIGSVELKLFCKSCLAHNGLLVLFFLMDRVPTILSAMYYWDANPFHKPLIYLFWRL